MSKNVLWTLAALVTFVLAIWLLLPSLNIDREDASRVKCASNLKQIGQALLIYSQEHNGELAPNLPTLLVTTDLVPEVFVCSHSDDKPTSTRELKKISIDFAKGGHCSYAYAPPPLKWSEIKPNDVIAFERDTHYDSGMNVLFGDGRVEFLMGEPVFSIYDQFAQGVRPIRLSP